jgi:hypothetical protein
MLTLLVAAVTLIALGACGGEDEPGGTPTSTQSQTQPESTASEEPTEEPSETESTTPAETETTTPADTADVEVQVLIAGGTVTTAEDRVALEVGQSVRITVTSDADDEIHVHGFELELPLVAGTPTEIEFVVGTTPGPGLYEVELHDSGLLLLQLEVR